MSRAAAPNRSLAALLILVVQVTHWTGLLTGTSAAAATRQELLSQPAQIGKWVAEGRIRPAQIPNPHWEEDGCPACHRNTPQKGSLRLRDRDVNALCNMCHSAAFDHSYIHPAAVKPRSAMKKRMPDAFKHKLDGKGALTCATCHDLKAQCLRKRARERGLNPLFFREGPYRERSDLCYRCHDDSHYQRRNAHDQVSDSGKMQRHTCLICHTRQKNLEKAASINQVGFHVKGDLMWICRSCHPWIPHPSGGFAFSKKQGIPDHLVVPSDGVLRKMERSEKARNLVLPLDPNTGRVFCATCHNPHEKGVIRLPAAAKGADEYKRLRTPMICLNCHDK